MADTGVTGGGAAVSVDTGADPWANPGNALVDDTNYAACDTAKEEEETDELYIDTFGFSLPGGSTVVGIVAVIDWDFQTYSYDTIVQLTDTDGSAKGDNLAAVSYRTPPREEIEFGGVENTWGASWTAAEINNAAFGIRIAFTAAQNWQRVYYITLQVYYTTAEGSFKQSMRIF